MGRIVTLGLNEEQKAELRKGYRQRQSKRFSANCQAILLKEEGYSRKDVAQMVGMSTATVQNWLRRYRKEGIKGLKLRGGSGRILVLDPEEEALLRKVMAEYPNSMRKAKNAYWAQGGKKLSIKTIRRYSMRLGERETAKR